MTTSPAGPLPPRSPRPPRTRTYVDAAATAVLSIALLVLVWWAFILGGMLQMMTGHCYDECNLDLALFGTVFAWAGIVVALVMAGIGVVRAHRRGNWMFPWPIGAALLIVVTWFVGLFIVDAAVS